MHIASQNLGFCRPKCSILHGKGHFAARRKRLKEKTTKKLRIVSKHAIEKEKCGEGKTITMPHSTKIQYLQKRNEQNHHPRCSSLPLTNASHSARIFTRATRITT